MRAIIAGGGIGGLTAALCLHAAGVEVAVREAVAEIRPLGVGINLLPHATRELAALGLLDALAALGVQTGELIYFSKFGRRIWREPRGRAAGYPWPQVSVARGELQALLLRAVRDRLGAGTVRTGHALVGFEQDGEGVTAHFAARRGGEVAVSERADLLIGADGIHSATRRACYPDEGPPRWNGAILWRGTTRAAPFLSGRTMIMAGHARQKFVCYPITGAGADGRATLNWVAELHFAPGELPEREDWNRRGDPAAFLPRFAGWRFDWLDIPALIAGAGAIYEYPMVDRDPLPRWSVGRATLLGDAAHPMYPVGSNGASQAILDARALADALAADADVPAALRTYEAARLPPTARLVLSNRQQGPERVMQLVEERAPDGFDDLDAVISRAELEAIAAEYKRLAGFDRESVERGA